jgi:GntR family transcriptional regulator
VPSPSRSASLQSRVPQYLRLRDEIASFIASGAVVAGELLPSEGELSERWSVSRVTVRRALALLKEEGLVESRRGFGWYVAGEPMRQSLDVLTTIEDQITAAGRQPTRQLLHFGLGKAPPHVAAVLDATSVLEIARCNLADGEPVGRNTAWITEDMARGLSIDAVERQSLHRLLPVTVTSATQTITAEGASETDATLLQVPAGTPLLRFNRTTRDRTGRAVLYSEAVYNPKLTEFTVELAASPSAQRAI